MNTTVRPAFELTDRWRLWVAENFLLGVGEQTILGVLIAQGMTEAQARAEFDAARNDVYLGAGEWVTQRLRKLESMLDALKRMRHLDPANADIPRQRGLSRQRFLTEYYAANRPVLLTDVTANWPAIRGWTPEYLRRTVGSEVVEVMTGREQDEQYEINLDAHRSSMRFSDYIDLVTRSGSTNDFYLVANNHFLDNPGPAALRADFDCDERYLDPARACGCR